MVSYTIYYIFNIYYYCLTSFDDYIIPQCYFGLKDVYSLATPPPPVVLVVEEVEVEEEVEACHQRWQK
jgi:hypothetical protein